MNIQEGNEGNDTTVSRIALNEDMLQICMFMFMFIAFHFLN